MGEIKTSSIGTEMPLAQTYGLCERCISLSNTWAFHAEKAVFRLE